MATIEVSGVCERDVDLLLLEELVASRPFFEWFLGRVGISPSAELIAVARSVTTSNGESDLELTIKLDDRIRKILVENKIDSIFQPRQADRYCERAAGYLRDGPGRRRTKASACCCSTRMAPLNDWRSRRRC